MDRAITKTPLNPKLAPSGRAGSCTAMNDGKALSPVRPANPRRGRPDSARLECGLFLGRVGGWLASLDRSVGGVALTSWPRAGEFALQLSCQPARSFPSGSENRTARRASGEDLCLFFLPCCVGLGRADAFSSGEENALECRVPPLLASETGNRVAIPIVVAAVQSPRRRKIGLCANRPPGRGLGRSSSLVLVLCCDFPRRRVRVRLLSRCGRTAAISRARLGGCAPAAVRYWPT